MSKSLSPNMHDAAKPASFLDSILSAFMKGSSAKEKKELEVYDKIEFVDANKEIAEEASKNGKKNGSKKKGITTK